MKKKTVGALLAGYRGKKIVYLIVYLNFNYCSIICTNNCKKIKAY